jgi:hypothetical protein
MRSAPSRKAAAKGGGAHRAAGAAQEQGLAEMGLELRQGNRQRGLRDVQQFGRQGHAFGAGDGGGIFELAQGNG